MIRNNSQDCFDVYSKYIGIPYKEPSSQCRDKNTGLHCWELAEKIMIEVFHKKPPIVHYTGPLDQVQPVFMTQLAAWDFIESGQQQPGDLIMLRMKGYPAHCGIMITPTLMIHVMPGKGRMSTCEDIQSIQWRHRILSFHRWNDYANHDSGKRTATQ